jgi:hypothetical protein
MCSLRRFLRIFFLISVITLRVKVYQTTRFVFWVLSGAFTTNILFSLEYCMKNINQSMEEDRKEFSLQIFYRQLFYCLFIKLNHLTSGLVYTWWIKCDNCRAESTLQVHRLLWNSISFMADMQRVFICTLVDVGGVPTSPQPSCVVLGKPMVKISARLLHFVMVPHK